MTDKLKLKIQLLLNKAANTPYPAEAKAFQEHAERLMVRHSIESLDGVEDTKFMTWTFYSKGQYRVVKHQGLISLARAFPHLAIFDTKMPGKEKLLNVVGTRDELEKFAELCASLELQCTHAMSAWWKTYTPDPDERPVTARRSFMLAFYVQCAARFRQLFTAEDTGSALVLVNNRANEWVSSQYDLKPGRPSGARKASRGGVDAGYRAANEADLGQRKVDPKFFGLGG